MKGVSIFTKYQKVTYIALEPKVLVVWWKLKMYKMKKKKVIITCNF